MHLSSTIRVDVAIAIVAAPISAYSAAPRPCDLFSPAEVASVTGVTPGCGQPEGPDVGKDLAATAWICGWPAGERYFATSLIRFRSAAEATRGRTEIAQLSKGIPKGIRLSAAPGPGEQALWGASAEGAVWVARKGQTIVVVVLAREVNRPESLRVPLRKLLAAGLARLP